MIYMDPALLSWHILHASYLNTLKLNKMNDTFTTLYNSLAEWLIPPILLLLANCERTLDISGTQQYKIFSQFITIHVSKIKQLQQKWFQQTFLYCFIWAFCSTLTNDGRKQMDPLLRGILYGTNVDYVKPNNFTLTRGQLFPEKYNFMDYYFDGIDTWWPWFTPKEDLSISANTLVSNIIIPTKETGFILNWLNICVTNQIPLSLIGPTGTGKSATILNYMKNLDANKFVLNTINFSARSTSNQIQELVLSKLDKRRKGVYGPPLGRSCLIFFDDVAMPSRDTYGSQSALELLRQWMDGVNWYDQDDASKIDIVDTYLNTAMGLIGGSNYIYPRFYRHTYVLAVDSFETTTLTHIFASIAKWHFGKRFNENITQWASGLASAMSFTYLKAINLFLPTPEKMHYAFSLRDMTRIFQGIVQVPPQALCETNKLIRLWIHETYRTFHDRLIDTNDRNLLLELMAVATKDNFRVDLDEVMADLMLVNDGDQSNSTELISNIIYGSFMDTEQRIYDEIIDLTEMELIVKAYLNEYNGESKSPMNLIFFKNALEHLSRVCRILDMPRGNILLVGMGGTGRRSIVKFSTFIMNADLVQLEIGQKYSLTEWRDDMKKILLAAGLNTKSLVLLISDTQIKDETFIDDINSLLNTADIPNLFPPDEMSQILDAMQNSMGKNVRSNLSPLALYDQFTERVRKYLHIALVFSPIGDSFKMRLRNYPSLISCCTIDWFDKWPNEALLRVAKSFVMEMALSENRSDTTESQHSTDTIADAEKSADNVAVERELDSKELIVVECIMYFHKSIEHYSAKFYLDAGRPNYVTPATYLELLRAFQSIYGKKYHEVCKSIKRYSTGLKQLENAAVQVAIMQKKLVDLAPELKILSEEAEKIMAKVTRETVEVTKKQELISADETIANEAAAAAQAIKDDCDNDLQKAIPILNAAVAALDTLKPADITIVKSMKNPPAGVKLVLEAVCVMRDFRPERGKDAAGKPVEDYWPASVRMLNDMKFIEILKHFDKDNIPAPVMKKIRDKYIINSEFVPEKIKNVSSACEGLCKWVRAVEVYDKTAKIVGPKKLALQAAQMELDEQMFKLEMKRAELNAIMAKVKELNDCFEEKSLQKQTLENEINSCAVKLTRAESLINGLLSEKIRWENVSQILNDSLIQVLGDVLLSSACVAYIGCYTINYRQQIIDNWKQKCTELNIPITTNYSIVHTLCSAIQIREWSGYGLPLDNFSQENAAILVNSKRYPLLIDPQGQAVKWIKDMEQKNDLNIIQMSNEKYLKILASCVSNGKPVLIENVSQTIDASIFPLLERNIIIQKGAQYIHFAGELLSFNSQFRLYITTCLSNPHYTPEISILVTLLNFVITEDGLQEQLLSSVIIQEQPTLQQLKESLILESAQNKDMLYNLETKILEVLETSGDNILEDEAAIEILTNSKLLSAEIEAKQIVAAKTEEEIDIARTQYVPIAQHASCLFFAISELAKLDSMYQYSIGWFTKLFVSTLKNTIKTDDIDQRIGIVQNEFARLLYENVCRSLFEKHKLVLSFVMCVGIMRMKSMKDDNENNQLAFLLTDGSLFENLHPNPAPQWLSSKIWDHVVRMQTLPEMVHFHQSFAENLDEWMNYYDLKTPEEYSLPAPYQNLAPLLKLIVVKYLRPDRMIRAIQLFIIESMGHHYIEPPIFDLNNPFKESDADTPIIFLLSSGSDPVASIYEYAKQQNMYEKCFAVSLGQGQGPRAEKLIKEGRENGCWIILQNCHVATSWLHNLEAICLDKEAALNTNEDYRLLCTSYPTTAFPMAILQKSIKITNEPPQGIKLNMLRSYGTDAVKTDSFNSPEMGDLNKFWQRGCFALVFFHAIILERRDYGPIGWNNPYEFNLSDLKISLQQLINFLVSYHRIPFEGHVYLTGECNYGGRVTDDKDRRLLMSLLNLFYNESSVDVDNYALSTCCTYRIPLHADIDECKNYISAFPIDENPEIVGLHSNASITKNIINSQALINNIFIAQRAFLKFESGNGTTKSENPILLLSSDILHRLPDAFDMHRILQLYPMAYTNSMNTVLQQEVRRYNNLLAVIKTSLYDAQRAIRGEIAMIDTIESVCSSMSIGKLPTQWASKSYPSIKPLSSYVTDLIARLEFLQHWIDYEEPKVFWMPGFYFTQSFITAILQNFARTNKVQIDLVSLENLVTSYESDTDVEQQIGVLIKGLYLEGARWDRISGTLDEPMPRILFDKLPIFDMIAKNSPLDNCLKSDGEYNAPLYQTTERRGTLSTTGHSTNFIMFLQLKTETNIEHWVNRGTAVFCQLAE